MDKKNNYFPLGIFKQSFGLDGVLILDSYVEEGFQWKKLKTIFVEQKKDVLIPFFLISVQVKNEKQNYFKLEDIHSKEAAFLLCRKKVWVTEDVFQALAPKNSILGFLGYTLIADDETLGIIDAIIEQPHQILCTVILDNKNEALIPLHGESLLEIDKKNKKVYVSLPNGLLDLYR